MGIKNLYSYLEKYNLIIKNDITADYNIVIFDIYNLLYNYRYIYENFNDLIKNLVLLKACFLDILNLPSKLNNQYYNDIINYTKKCNDYKSEYIDLFIKINNDQNIYNNQNITNNIKNINKILNINDINEINKINDNIKLIESLLMILGNKYTDNKFDIEILPDINEPLYKIEIKNKLNRYMINNIFKCIISILRDFKNLKNIHFVLEGINSIIAKSKTNINKDMKYKIINNINQHLYYNIYNIIKDKIINYYDDNEVNNIIQEFDLDSFIKLFNEFLYNNIKSNQINSLLINNSNLYIYGDYDDDVIYTMNRNNINFNKIYGEADNTIHKLIKDYMIDNKNYNILIVSDDSDTILYPLIINYNININKRKNICNIDNYNISKNSFNYKKIDNTTIKIINKIDNTKNKIINNYYSSFYIYLYNKLKNDNKIMDVLYLIILSSNDYLNNIFYHDIYIDVLIQSYIIYNKNVNIIYIDDNKFKINHNNLFIYLDYFNNNKINNVINNKTNNVINIKDENLMNYELQPEKCDKINIDNIIKKDLYNYSNMLYFHVIKTYLNNYCRLDPNLLFNITNIQNINNDIINNTNNHIKNFYSIPETPIPITDNQIELYLDGLIFLVDIFFNNNINSNYIYIYNNYPTLDNLLDYYKKNHFTNDFYNRYDKYNDDITLYKINKVEIINIILKELNYNENNDNYKLLDNFYIHDQNNNIIPKYNITYDKIIRLLRDYRNITYYDRITNKYYIYHYKIIENINKLLLNRNNILEILNNNDKNIISIYLDKLDNIINIIINNYNELDIYQHIFVDLQDYYFKIMYIFNNYMTEQSGIPSYYGQRINTNINNNIKEILSEYINDLVKLNIRLYIIESDIYNEYDIYNIYNKYDNYVQILNYLEKFYGTLYQDLNNIINLYNNKQILQDNKIIIGLHNDYNYNNNNYLKSYKELLDVLLSLKEKNNKIYVKLIELNNDFSIEKIEEKNNYYINYNNIFYKLFENINNIYNKNYEQKGGLYKYIDYINKKINKISKYIEKI